MQMTAATGLPRNEFLGSQGQTFHSQRQQGNFVEKLQINSLHFITNLLASHEKIPVFQKYLSAFKQKTNTPIKYRSERD